MKGKLLRIIPFGIALICLGSAFLTVGCGSSNARYRFVQAATGLNNNVDVQVDGKTVLTSVGFGNPGTYHSVKSGSRHFQIFPTGTTTNAYVDASVSVENDTTLIMVTPPPPTGIALSVFTDDNTAPTTGNAKIRVINTSTTASANGVDVYVVPHNSGIGGFNPQITSLTFNNPSNYLSLAAGDYDVAVTQPGTQNIINSLTFTFTGLASGQIRTLVIIESSFGGGPYTFVQLNDLN
jgi:Domain of unknown function (DUF4397)